MKSALDMNVNEQFGLLLQGPPKTGKTELAALFPSPWIANADANLSGFVRRAKAQNYQTDLLVTDIMRDDEGVQITHVRDQWKRFISESTIAMQDPKIKTIVFDSMTTLTMIATGYIPYDRSKKDGAGMEIQDWNTHQNLWKTIVMRMRASGKRFVCIVHEEAVKSELDGGLSKWIPLLPGNKLQCAFAGFFSDVWRTEVETNTKDGTSKYLIRVKPTAKLDLGGSINFTTPTIIRPDSLQEQADLLKKLLGD